jgi:flavin reductase (DIM6/NTAB) family NADH-FMN oxidoreductase RutF
MECELAEVIETDYVYQIIGKVINTKVNEEVLDEKGKVDPVKLNALMFDTFQSGYYTIGEKAGQAWNSGAELMKK